MVDQARVRHEAGEPRTRRRLRRQVEKRAGHRGPGASALRVLARVAVAGPIADPARLPAVGHRHRHAAAAGREHVAKGRELDDPLQGFYQGGLERPRELAQQHRSRGQLELPRGVFEQVAGRHGNQYDTPAASETLRTRSPESGAASRWHPGGRLPLSSTSPVSRRGSTVPRRRPRSRARRSSRALRPSRRSPWARTPGGSGTGSTPPRLAGQQERDGTREEAHEE